MRYQRSGQVCLGTARAGHGWACKWTDPAAGRCTAVMAAGKKMNAVEKNRRMEMRYEYKIGDLVIH